MTLDESRLIVLATTPPHPSSKALPMTLAFVPGGPEPMTKGLGNLMPLTVVSSVGIAGASDVIELLCVVHSIPNDARGAEHQEPVDDESDGECEEPGVGVEPDPPVGD